MYTRSWQVIKDEDSKTFEVVTQASNDNAFTNKVYAMQKDGLNVNGVILPVTNKNSNKDSIKFIGYTQEPGLYHKLLKRHQDVIMKNSEFWDE